MPRGSFSCRLKLKGSVFFEFDKVLIILIFVCCPRGWKMASGNKKMRLRDEHRCDGCVQLGSRGERRLLGGVFLLERLLQRCDEPLGHLVDFRHRVRHSVLDILVDLDKREDGSSRCSRRDHEEIHRKTSSISRIPKRDRVIRPSNFFFFFFYLTFVQRQRTRRIFHKIASPAC